MNISINQTHASNHSNSSTLALLFLARDLLMTQKTYEASNAALRAQLRQFLKGVNPLDLIDRDTPSIEGTVGPEIEATYEVPAFGFRRLLPWEIDRVREILSSYVSSPCEKWNVKANRRERFTNLLQRIGLKKLSLINDISPSSREIFIDHVNSCADQLGISGITA